MKKISAHNKERKSKSKSYDDVAYLAHIYGEYANGIYNCTF